MALSAVTMNHYHILNILTQTCINCHLFSIDMTAGALHTLNKRLLYEVIEREPVYTIYNCYDTKISTQDIKQTRAL